MNAQCGNCKYALLVEAEGSIQCRRFPPQVLLMQDGRVHGFFPPMPEHGWCGEHRPAILEAGGVFPLRQTQ